LAWTNKKERQLAVFKSAQVPGTELKERLRRFRAGLAERNGQAALITAGPNVRYLSGFTGDDSALLVTPHHRFLLTDFRYIEEAQRSAPGWRVVLKPQGLMDKAGLLAKKLRLKKLFIESAGMRLIDLRILRKAALGVRLTPQDGLVGELRLIKSAWEIKQIEAALRIQEAGLRQLCRFLKPGITEAQAAAKLRYLMALQGAEDEAFPGMFQIGSHSSLPHGRPGGRALPGAALVLVDWGAKVSGYHSDLTRTFFLGTITPRLREIHGIVLEAQRRAIERVAPGVAQSEIDRAAREHIAQAGFGKAFGHSTGHGIGLEIHEGPYLSSRAKSLLRAGMVVTVEPGIYLPGVGGVRIEDDVLVTATGHRVLSRMEKGLRWNG
jgi:Xaa-Pro aminopeptidase